MPITLAEGVSNTLLSLQRTTNLIDKTQFKLATGNKVNSALDDPLAFFQSRALSDRAGDLLVRKDQIEQGIKTIEAAVNGLEAIESTLKTMKALADQARAASTTTEREVLRGNFSTLFTQLSDLAEDASYQGTNLLETDNLSVTFDERNLNSLTINARDSRATGLGVASVAASGWSAVSAVELSISQIDAAISSVRNNSRALGTELTFLQIRSEFTDSLTTTLETGATQLIRADLNTESANLLALQTRQQLGTSALSIAAQSEQSVLRLF